jgi:uncharacterized protein YndB with AHSA1/START domain
MAYEVSTSIEITATPENVWAVLTDLARYPQWHPLFRSVTGQLTAGSKLTIRTTVPSTGRPMTVKVKVVKAEPPTELRWVSKLLGLTISKRRFLLSPSGGGTLLVQAETYRDLSPAAAQSRWSAASRTPSWRSTRPSSGKPRLRRGNRANENGHRVTVGPTAPGYDYARPPR